ncbi:succinylglutamate desuccinylase/aspartoacylase domain-containing protein [Histidinibacterium aquaticum]|uniref:Succinylglutamate desuccinylase/aspartoacylase family protein n=1 Tax=Histidinibacterium aquaticum TaxID=2613962 RepID=A0A5J5GJA2_9RHOB|nr:succinylglutamate desuccinylase/aspartoacylase family protein [Histidinibacterium aquaticum]KAA9008130.1 succinylglutamate desuccinylase/aspartoacylase family protein [Histidinibacterium aquaticum]
MDVERIGIEADSAGQEFFLRVLRFRGTGEAPTVYLQAALHAHEVPGVVALDRLIPRLEQAEGENRLAGDVIVVPQANPVGASQALFGETQGRFDFNGRTNFNRGFPPAGAETDLARPVDERLKSTLLSLACEADIVLDLHCDHDGPVYLYVHERMLEEGRTLARSLRARAILTDSGEDPFSFVLKVNQRWNEEGRANDRRFSATVELRSMIDVTADLAEQDALGLYRYLVETGTVVDRLQEAPAEEPVTGDIGAAELVLTPAPGAMMLDVEVGEWVAEGQRLAEIITEAGLERHEIRAPFEGMVLTRFNRRIVRRGDYVAKILRHERPASAG